jgi:metal-responsive CopG/Arc/MetJ family transcriptional regulator
MPVTVQLPDDLATEIDHLAEDRSRFVAEAVRHVLRERSSTSTAEEVARIDAAADELNREAADVLEYQAIR